MSFTSRINRALRRHIGVEIHKTRAGFDEARNSVIKMKSVSLIVDGGANSGQYAMRIRREGYSGKILSIEPGAKAFEALVHHATNDLNWNCVKAALGAKNDSMTLNLSSNEGMSSSLRKPGLHLIEFPTVTFDGGEVVNVITLESLLTEVKENVYLKLDVQGFELEALQGIGSQLHKICVLELEMTLVSMYEGESTLGEVLTFVESLGFFIFSISEFGKNKEGRVTYFDIIAIKSDM